MTKFSLEQTNYMVAQATFETIREMYAEKVKVAGLDDLYETDFDKAFDIDEEISVVLGYHEAYELVSQREKELVDWAFSQVKMVELYKKNLEELEALRSATKTSLIAREKVAKLAMKLAV